MAESNRYRLDIHMDSNTCTQRLCDARTALNARISLDEFRAAKRRMNTGKAVD